MTSRNGDSWVGGDEQEHHTEEAAFRMWLKVFITVRWITALGILAAILVATRVFDVEFETMPAYAVCGFVALCNLVLIFQSRSLTKVPTTSSIHRARNYGTIHLLLDLAAFAVLLHFTGGIENPFVFYFVLHIIGASIILPYTAVYLLATSVIAMVSLLVGLEYAGVIPHVNLAGFADPGLYREGGYILAVLVVLATALFAATYMATSVAGELRKRQREVMQLSQRSLDKRTRELEQASHEVAKLEEARNRFLQFLGVTVHDLKAPLTAIQSYFWVMLGGFAGPLTDKQRGMLERSSQRIKELLTLVSDLLDIPRIETGQIAQEMEDISLNKLIETCVADLRDQAKQKKVKLKVEVPRSLPRIRGSVTRLQQVLANLLNNAINYTPKGAVTLRVSKKADELLVEVSDTGIGIPADDLPRIFEDFFRASNVETKGTGLGLSIAKRIVETHQGRIWVESPCSETGKGSKFCFTLPRKRRKRR